MKQLKFYLLLGLTAISGAGASGASATTASYTKIKNQYVTVNQSKIAYRVLGQAHGKPPLVLFQHFTGNMDDWDSALIDGLAKNRKLYIFDNLGLGASEGPAPDNVADMTKVAIGFIDALKLKKVDVLGFSLGGFIAQQILVDRPELLRKVILLGTGPQGGQGIKNLQAVLQVAFKKGAEANVNPRAFLFFTETNAGHNAAVEFLKRVNNHTVDQEPATSNETMGAQAKALITWGSMPDNFANLAKIQHPVLIVNGSNDLIIPTPNSFELFKSIPNGQLSLYPDSGHGALFQYHDLFTSQVNTFLDGVK